MLRLRTATIAQKQKQMAYNITNNSISPSNVGKNDENFDSQKSNGIMQNSNAATNISSDNFRQNSLKNEHDAIARTVIDGKAATDDKNFLLRFFENIAALLKQIITSFYFENTVLTFDTLKSNLENHLRALQTSSKNSTKQAENVRTRLCYLKELETMGALLKFRYQSFPFSNSATKENVDNAKRKCEILETIGTKNFFNIPNGIENAWKCSKDNHRLLNQLSSDTIHLTFDTFKKLYKQLQTEDCCSNKEFTDAMEATSKTMKTVIYNMQGTLDYYKNLPLAHSLREIFPK